MLGSYRNAEAHPKPSPKPKPNPKPRPTLMQALGKMEGPDVLVDERVVAQLGQIVRNFEPLLVAARADRHQMEFDRQMREEQAEEYARALAEDQARCREI